MKLAYVSSLSALLAACAVGPNYEAPQTPPAEFVGADAVGVAKQPFEAKWWGQFGDPVLDDLVARALSGDLDLKTAAARVQEARALLGVAQRTRWPGVTGQASHSESDEQIPGFTTDRVDVKSNELGLSSLWEIDLFGRLRRGVEAAGAEEGAAEARLRDAQVLVAAEVALSYLDLRGAQKRLAVAEANLGYQRETLDLTKIKLNLGSGTQLDVVTAQARLAATEAEIPPLKAIQSVAANRLAVLLGLRPGALTELLAPREVPPHLTTLAVGAPEDLLKRRPDIRAAERELAAATARVGIATADLFPRLSLSGFIGFVSGDASQIGDTQARAWSFGPSLTWAGFGHGGRARVAAAEARTDAALATYESTVLRALEEAEDGAVVYGAQRQRLTSLIEQASASREAAELARVRYQQGVVDFLRLLDAERTRLQAEDALAAVETDLNQSVVLIYKALGGGWEAAQPQS